MKPLPNTISGRARRLLEIIDRNHAGVCSRDQTQYHGYSVVAVDVAGLSALLLPRYGGQAPVTRYKGAGRKTVDELRAICKLPPLAPKQNENVRLLKLLDQHLSGVVAYEQGVINDSKALHGGIIPRTLVAQLIRRLS